MDEKEETPHYIGHRERLRERFLRDEGKSMSDYELMELLLMIAIPRRDVKERAKNLIKEFGSFLSVIAAPVHKLEKFGLKRNTIAVLKIVSASARRASWNALEEKEAPVYTDHESLVSYCHSELNGKEVEEFYVMFLDNKAHMIGQEMMQRGTINSVNVHPREVVRLALEKGAASVVLMHNHPSGDPNPSKSDLDTTKNIEKALGTMGIKVADHVIVGKNSHYSFLEHGILLRQSEVCYF